MCRTAVLDKKTDKQNSDMNCDKCKLENTTEAVQADNSQTESSVVCTCGKSSQSNSTNGGEISMADQSLSEKYIPKNENDSGKSSEIKSSSGLPEGKYLLFADFLEVTIFYLITCIRVLCGIFGGEHCSFTAN